MAPLRQFVSKFRFDRGPLRWWLIAAGLPLVRYDLWRFAVGTVLVLIGAILHLLAKGYLRQSRKYLRRTQSLTTRGPYRFTRNPFYLGNLCAEIGLLVIIGQPYIAVAYLIVWAWVYRKTILAEEISLTQFCGEAYERYRTQVPPLLPVPWKYLAKSDGSGPRFSWRNPNILGGREIERALRLLSYPLLLRVAAAVHEMDKWSLSDLSAGTVCSAAGFVLLNVLGWCSTRILNLSRESTVPGYLRDS